MNDAKFRAMIDGGAPDWDVADITIDFLYAGITDRLFEKIDTKLVDIGRIDPQFVNEYGIGCIVWSYNLGYSTKVLSRREAPKTWADLFDLKRFPGKRTIGDNACPIARGRAARRWRCARQALSARRRPRAQEARHHQARPIFWSTNSQSQQLFVDGEVTLGIILNGRVYDAAQKGRRSPCPGSRTSSPIDYLVVPRGSRNRDAAMRLIDTMTVPENQAKLANMIAYSPTNPAAFKSIDPKIEPWLSTAPENAKKGFVINAHIWRDNLKPLMERWNTGNCRDAKPPPALRVPNDRFDRRIWLLLPAVLILLVAFIGPVGWLLSRAFTQPRLGFREFRTALAPAGLSAGHVEHAADQRHRDADLRPARLSRGPCDDAWPAPVCAGG